MSRGIQRLLDADEVEESVRPYVDYSQQRIKARTGHVVLIRCPECQWARWAPVGRIRRGGTTYCSSCFTSVHNRQRVGILSSGWKGGRSTRQGYVVLRFSGIPLSDRWLIEHEVVTLPGKRWGTVLEHRYIAAKKYGRPLLREERVRHLNGVRDDNRPHNLVTGTALENTMDHETARRTAMYWHNTADALREQVVLLGGDPDMFLQSLDLDSQESPE